MTEPTARRTAPKQLTSPSRFTPTYRCTGRYSPLNTSSSRWPGTGRYTAVCRACGLHYRPAGAPGFCPTCGEALDV